MRGIDFSATAFFLVVVVNQWREHRSRLPFLTAAVCALGFYLLLGSEYFLIPTLVTCLAALILLRKPIEEKEGTQEEKEAKEGWQETRGGTQEEKVSTPKTREGIKNE